MLWEIYQQGRIAEARGRADAAAEQSRGVKSALHELERRTDRLALTTMAIWQLMSEKMGVTEADLEDKIREIDLSDGKLDGRVRVETNTCASCNRRLSKRHTKCMYCGADASQGIKHL